jgi:hypothetical protein
LLTACTGAVSSLDAGLLPEDAGTEDAGLLPPDAGVPDAGALPDAGTRPDAGSAPDAGAPDAGTHDAGTPSACPPSALFCESFETGLDSARWLTNGNASAFTVDTTTPTPDGHASLHLAYGTPYAHTGTPTVQLKTLVSTPDDRIYLRTYLRFGNLGLPGAHPAFLDVADSTGRELGFGSIINDFALLAWTPGGLDNARIWYEGGGNWHPGIEDGDATPASENGLAAQSWFCVEMMFFGDHQSPSDTQHPNEQVTVWINGTEIPQLAASDALWPWSSATIHPSTGSPSWTALAGASAWRASAPRTRPSTSGSTRSSSRMRRSAASPRGVGIQRW